MAIDTNAKKASMMNLGTPWYVMGPLLDGAFSQGEIQHMLHLYSGILAGTLTTPTDVRVLAVSKNRRSVTMPEDSRILASRRRRGF